MCKILDALNLNNNELVCWDQMSHRYKVEPWSSALCLVQMELPHCLNQEPSNSLERYFCMYYHFAFLKTYRGVSAWQTIVMSVIVNFYNESDKELGLELRFSTLQLSFKLSWKTNNSQNCRVGRIFSLVTNLKLAFLHIIPNLQLSRLYQDPWVGNLRQ